MPGITTYAQSLAATYGREHIVDHSFCRNKANQLSQMYVNGSAHAAYVPITQNETRHIFSLAFRGDVIRAEPLVHKVKTPAEIALVLAHLSTDGGTCRKVKDAFPDLEKRVA